MEVTSHQPSAQSDLSKLKDLIRSESFPFWLFLVLWFGQLCLALEPSWGDGTYYDYGYMVILLVPFFFHSRWSEIKGAGDRLIVEAPKMVQSPLVVIFFGAAFCSIVMLRLIQTVDSGWRAPLVVHAFLMIGFAAFCLSRVIGGRALLTFFPCAVLILLAVPLPSAVEFSLIHGLTERVVDTAVFANRMLGLPVTSSGETLFANGIPLHVSEGCSGIRSFQSSIFAGFVLGEFIRLSILNRLILLGLSLFTAFCMNCLRVIYLVQHAAGHPGADLQKVHDISGYVSLTLTFITIFALSSFLKKSEHGGEQQAAAATV
ncbi:MAG: exosortase/archaeosortase family protein [Verrucomicrobiales bacterium]|nr:exosortase/archaeosortase family protein [Verrucomicrobiales bacterium]